MFRCLVYNYDFWLESYGSKLNVWGWFKTFCEFHGLLFSFFFVSLLSPVLFIRVLEFNLLELIVVAVLVKRIEFLSHLRSSSFSLYTFF